MESKTKKEHYPEVKTMELLFLKLKIESCAHAY